MSKKENTKRITSIGGQALIEGIMMRGPKTTSIAVRKSSGEIVFENMETKAIKDKHPILGFPFIRGIVSFIESLKLGYKSLEKSIDLSGISEEESESKFEKWLTAKFGDKLDKFITAAGGIIGVALAVFLFLFLPTVIFNLLLSAFGESLTFWRSPIEGALRLAVLIIYVTLCSLVPDIKRVFQYHGAEHKTIFCYEAEEELTVENVRKHSRFHPRCGTSFMVIIIVIGIIAGFFIPFSNPFIRTGIKILCIPVVVGIGYEILKACGRHDNTLTRIVSAPGKWVQRITTKEPDDSMIEVAIAAMKNVIPEGGEDII